jgi:hypothetical protein
LKPETELPRFAVKVRLDNPEGHLRAGVSVEVKFQSMAK